MARMDATRTDHGWMGASTTTTAPSIEISANEIILNTINGHDKELRYINKKIWENPELGYKEYQAHDNIIALLHSLGFSVISHAFGLETSFSCEVGTGGRVLVFNPEYDALPHIGHACGHNLIATASIASFLAVAAALRTSRLAGRVRLYGTPAEESGGGKIKLIDAGAYKDVDACLMVHPGPPQPAPVAQDGHHGCCVPTGKAYYKTLANKKFNVTYTGRPAHAAMAPYQGINALDAVVLAYNGVSMLRQQTKPHDRIHSVIADGGQRPNVITSYAKSDYYVRSATLQEVTVLHRRVRGCLDGAATATGCEIEYEEDNEYAELRPNRTLCALYAEAMSLPSINSPVTCDFRDTDPFPGSTDQGNVSYVVPSFHGGYAIPCAPDAFNHTPAFTQAAGSEDAYLRTVDTSKGMALAGWRVLSEKDVVGRIWKDFDEDNPLSS